MEHIRNNLTNLLLLGGGGHCVSVLDAIFGVIRDQEDSESGIAILDVSEKVGQTVLGVPIIGTDADLSILRESYDKAFIALGSIGDWSGRERLYQEASLCKYNFPVVKHPASSVSKYSKIDDGVFVGMGALVNAGSSIGVMSILNSGSIIEHECVVGRFSHIAPGAVLCAEVHVGEGSHVGAGSIIRQGLSVGSGSIIGAGSVVTRDIPENVVAYGNPCRVIWKKTRRL
jgi:sugar O-acyltransferase (sialic acid O-acetyltransferase NeuD family)